MALISLRQFLDHAAENGYGVPAFNVDNMEQMHAIMEAADEADSPVIVQASAGARKCAGPAFLRHLNEAAMETWPQIINNYGGDMGQTYGVPVEEIQNGIRNGVRKVNIDADLRMASTGAVRKFIAENPKDFDPRKFLAASTRAMKEICKARFDAFGCSGNASSIQPISLELMSRRYQAGELDPSLH